MLATVGPDGLPQQTAVWFLADGETVRISLNPTRQKTKNLRRNRVCSLFILDLQNPYRYIELPGKVAIEPDPDYAFADLLGAKYDANLRMTDHAERERVVVTVESVKVNAVDMNA